MRGGEGLPGHWAALCQERSFKAAQAGIEGVREIGKVRDRVYEKYSINWRACKTPLNFKRALPFFKTAW